MNATANRHVIVHHFGERITDALARRWPQFSVIGVNLEQAWTLPEQASVLLAGPSKLLPEGPPQRPDHWPRALHWVQLAAAGVDGYPAWLLRHPIVTTARGVNSVPTRLMGEPWPSWVSAASPARLPSVRLHLACAWSR